MSKPLTIVARIRAKEDSVELIKAELLKLIEPTLKEEGCIQYDLHQDNSDPTVFLFFENWETRDLWQNHMNSEHLSAHKKATEGAVESVEIYEMTHVDKP